MDNKEISLIFNEKAREVFSNQEEKYKLKRKYTGLYCCSEEEVIRLQENFQEMLENKEEMNFQKFKELISQGD